MTLYVDTSALLKRYIAERDSGVAGELMAADPVLVTSPADRSGAAPQPDAATGR